MAFDEMKAQDGGVRKPYRAYENWLLSAAPDLLPRKHEQADELFRRIGITFNVYGDQEGTERLIPFDPIPRILTAKEWSRVHDGCIQRVNKKKVLQNAGLIQAARLADGAEHDRQAGVGKH